MSQTPLRNIRIPDEIWGPAKQAARNRDTTVSAIVREHLTSWLEVINTAENWRNAK